MREEELVAYYLKRKKYKQTIELFVLQLIVLGKIEIGEFHREVGKWYGFPKCCIDNYINLLRKGYPPAKYMHDVYGHRHKLPMVLCNDCHNIYQHYVGSNYESNFVK